VSAVAMCVGSTALPFGLCFSGVDFAMLAPLPSAGYFVDWHYFFNACATIGTIFSALRPTT
jgi:hypothetical protein